MEVQLSWERSSRQVRSDSVPFRLASSSREGRALASPKPDPGTPCLSGSPRMLCHPVEVSARRRRKSLYRMNYHRLHQPGIPRRRLNRRQKRCPPHTVWGRGWVPRKSCQPGTLCKLSTWLHCTSQRRTVVALSRRRGSNSQARRRCSRFLRCGYTCLPWCTQSCSSYRHTHSLQDTPDNCSCRPRSKFQSDKQLL